MSSRPISRRGPSSGRKIAMPSLTAGKISGLFQELDTDGDAQIGLYEWKASGRPLDEFFKMDRNGDGFLTVQEVLYYTSGQNKNGNGAAGANAAGDQSRSSFFSGPGGNGRR